MFFSDNYTKSLYTGSLQISSETVWAEAKKTLTFSSEKADYDAFATYYQREANKSDFMDHDNVAKAWQGRKCTAIPYMIYGLLESIYHLAQAIFSCLVCTESECCPSSDRILPYVYCIIRDLEEIYGNFICVFYDQLGLYHIQQAQFEKERYLAYKPQEVKPERSTTSSMERSTEPSRLHLNGKDSGFKHLDAEFTEKYSISRHFWSASSGKYNADTYSTVNDAAQKITLSDYKSLSELGRQELTDYLRIRLTQLTEKFSLSQFLEQNDDETLELFTLEDLLYFDQSPLQFVIMDDEQIKKLTFADLQKGGEKELNAFINIVKSKVQYLKLRLEALPQEEDDLESPTESKTLFGLLLLNAEEIRQQKDNLPPLAFAFFRHDEITQLSLPELNLAQNTAIFGFLSSSDARELLTQFNEVDVINAVQNNRLPKSALLHVPANYFSQTQTKLVNEQ